MNKHNLYLRIVVPFSSTMAKKYTQKQLLDAVAAVRQGLSYRKASVKYGVPSMTIQNRVSGKIDDLAVAGRPTVIPPEIEEEIVKKIKKAADMGFGITRRMLKVKVGRIVRKLGIKTPFRNGIPGKDWVAGFMSRHKDISLRKPLALSTCRARMLNKTITDNFYNDLHALLLDTGLNNQPMKIWNIDETSVPLLHKPVKVLGQTGAKNIPGRVGNSRDNVSVLACINAAGGHIPPLVIVKGKTYKSLLAYNTEAGVPGTVYTYQERAWMEDALGELWFQDHFLKHCGPERPQIIIMDSHSSHETLGLIDAAIANDIIFLAFPPHTTQWLCPLDKTIFGPLSREFSRVCTEFMASSPNNIVNKWEWPRLFKNAFTKSFNSANITSGFRKCGIYPVDSGALPASALAPSEPFDISNKNESDSVSKCGNENPVAKIVPNKLPPEETVPVATNYVAAEPFSGEVLSEGQLIDLVLSGACPCTIDPETGNIELEIELNNGASLSATPVPSNHDWSTEVNATFSLPVSDRKINENKQNPRKLTSHRILTSKEVVDKKREDFDKKNKIKVEKEKRQQMKLLKKEEKMIKKERC